MHFLVFIPGDDVSRETGLASVGLSTLQDDAQSSDTINGPDGKVGRLFGFSQSTPLVYRQNQQEWVPAYPLNGLDAGRYHVGFWKDKPPTPADLQRPFPITGRAVRFGDGNDWVVPSVVDLPYTLVRSTADGRWLYRPLERFSSLLLASNVWRDRLSGECVGTPMLDSDLADLVELALSVNYRLTTEVVSRLGMFTSGESENLAKAALWLLRREGDANG